MQFFFNETSIPTIPQAHESQFDPSFDFQQSRDQLEVMDAPTYIYQNSQQDILQLERQNRARGQAQEQALKKLKKKKEAEEWLSKFMQERNSNIQERKNHHDGTHSAEKEGWNKVFENMNLQSSEGYVPKRMREILLQKRGS